MSEKLAQKTPPNEVHLAVEQLSGMSFPVGAKEANNPHISFPEIQYGKPIREIVFARKYVNTSWADEEAVHQSSWIDDTPLDKDQKANYDAGKLKEGDSLPQGTLIVEQSRALFTKEAPSSEHPDGLLVVPANITVSGLMTVIRSAYDSHNSYSGSENRNRRFKGAAISRGLIDSLLTHTDLSANIIPASHITIGNKWEEWGDDVLQPEKRAAKLPMKYPELTSEQIADIQEANELGLPLNYCVDRRAGNRHNYCLVITPDGNDRPADRESERRGSRTGVTCEWYAIRKGEIVVRWSHARGTSWNDSENWSGGIFDCLPKDITDEQRERLNRLKNELGGTWYGQSGGVEAETGWYDDGPVPVEDSSEPEIVEQDMGAALANLIKLNNNRLK